MLNNYTIKSSIIFLVICLKLYHIQFRFQHYKSIKTAKFTIKSSFGFGPKKNDERYKTFTITITSSEHGLDANDSVRSINATFNITSGKDGIHSDNSDDTSLGFVYVENGTFNITSEGYIQSALPL